MTVTHLSECGKEKLKNWLVIPANSGNPECLVIATRLQLRAMAQTPVIARRRSRHGNPAIQTTGLLHFVRNDGKGVVNYGGINRRLSCTVT